MTEKLYYADSYLKEFTASVKSVDKAEDYYHVKLDRTAFYPTSGGQLFDTGCISDEKVIDVIESNDDVIHVLETKPPFQSGDEVNSRIDWERRRDNMQKHTGQHILSQAFIKVCDAATISARLGEEDSTIDLDISQLNNNLVIETENLANRIIFENRTVSTKFAPVDELDNYPLRKIPDRSEDKYRIIIIDDFDWSACGGTHCSTTGSVGIIKITGQEKIRGNLRFHFLTGLKALEDYRWRFNQVEDISNLFSCHARDSFRLIEHIIAENNNLRREKDELRKKLLPVLIEEWVANPKEINGHKLISIDLSGEDFSFARDAGLCMINNHNAIVLIGVDDRLLTAVSKSIPISALDIMNKASQIFGGKGGGSPELAQGGGFSPDDIKFLIAHPEKVIDI
ncbi:MAG: alanine--tRNA ligase-related protein [candidate division Zixibacteria bacterium]